MRSTSKRDYYYSLNGSGGRRSADSDASAPIDPLKDGKTPSPSGSDASIEFETYENGKRLRLSAEERHLLKTTFCEICGGLNPFDDNPIILCDGHRCNKAYHISCLSPPLDKVPEGDFMGPCCQASKRTSMKGSVGGTAGRGHMRRSRLLNRSQLKPTDEELMPSSALPIKGLFSQFSQSFSNRRKSNLVESIEDTPVPRPTSDASADEPPAAVPTSVDWHQTLMTSHEKLIQDLGGIVGMDRIKDLLIDINCKINLRKERIRRSVSARDRSDSAVGSGMAPHIVLIGNPGTGKSMIGRILAKMLHRSQAVKRNIFVKAHRSDLVAGYLGQTALKTAQLIEQARGGIMFVDEAHQLINPNKEDYGIEAYREIMKEMLSDHAVDEDRVTFIFAGYPKQMNRFLSHDAGMQSRISFRIQLPDYSLADLAKICESKLTNRNPADGLPTQMDSGIKLEEILGILPSELVPRYNARIADLLLDKAEASLAKRMLLSPEITEDVDITRLVETDFRHAAVSLRYEMLQANSSGSPDSSDSEESGKHI